MKLTINLIFLLSFAIFTTVVNPKAKASHAAGGELLYEWVNGTTYKIVFKFYRDCSGITESNKVNACVFNSCTNTSSTLELTKPAIISGGRPNGSQVDIGCPVYKNSCDGGSLPGYREWWYEGTIDLAGRCNIWRFSVSINARNGSNNIGSGDLYVEATLNNQSQDNSSPIFSTKPVPYVCLNNPYTYNNGAVDKDNDSLVFQTVMPLTNISGACNLAGTPLVFAAKIPALNLNTNPFQTNNTFSINTQTGNIRFTPGELGPQTTVLKVIEYRNGVMVGSTMRDIQVQVLPCNSVPMAYQLDTLNIVNATLVNGIIEACINKPVSFCYDIVSTDTAAIMAISDNKYLSVPAATINYTNNATDSVRGCFSWTPTLADTGLKILTITAKDSTCRAPGISISQTFTIPIRINSFALPPGVITPQELCRYSTSLPLTATGNNLLWYSVPVGGTGSPTAPVPGTSTLGIQSFYVSHIPNGCVSPRARIDVNIIPSPTVDLQSPKDTVCAHEQILLTDIIANKDSISYLWQADSGQIEYTSDANRVYVSWPAPGKRTIFVKVSNSVCTTVDSVEVFVLPTPRAFFHVFKNTCINRPVSLEPLEANGSYHWQVDGATISDTIFKPAYSLSWNAPGKRYARLTMTGENSCSTTYIDSITVHPFPIAEILHDNPVLCQGKEFTLSAAEGYRYSYSWSPPQYFHNNTDKDVKGTAGKTGYIYLTVANAWNCISTDSFFVNAEACCEIIFPNAFTPNGNGYNDVFKAINPSGKKVVEFMVANRRGQIIFTTKDITKGWDGTHNGQPAAQDTYNYYIKYLCNNTEEAVKKGTVILMR